LDSGRLAWGRESTVADLLPAVLDEILALLDKPEGQAAFWLMLGDPSLRPTFNAFS